MMGNGPAFNIERARRVYEGIRDCWVAGGGALEAHDRLALVTVAAEARETAFLTMIEPEHQATVTRVMKEAGLEARPWTPHFDVELEPGDFEEPDGGVSSA